MLNERKEIFRIKNNNLPEASKKMNFPGESCFMSYISDIIIGEEYSIVIVTKQGSYPHIEAEWEKIIENVETIR